MICADCRQEITDDPRQDNRYRGCSVCGWRMHHGCWVERLSMGALPCPSRVESVQVERMVPAEGLTPTGRQRQRRVTFVEDYREPLPGHGTVMGMRGEWEQL